MTAKLYSPSNRSQPTDLRSFATHLVARYTRVATGMIASIESPLDLLTQSSKRPRRSSKAPQPA